MLAALPASATSEQARVLEIGGGVGALQAELLRAGAGSGEVVELLGVYEPYARRLAERLGIAERTSFRVVDLLAYPAAVEPADVVLLNRVVCCSSEGPALTAAAARLTRGSLALIFPRANLLSRALAAAERALARLFRRKFMIFVWSVERLTSAAASGGLVPVASGGTLVWRYLVFAKPRQGYPERHMSTIPTLPGVTSQRVETPRLTMHVLTSGPEDGTPVLFIHGNASSSTFWEEVMVGLPAGFRAIAPDLRGYGSTDDVLVDATRGVGDWVDDLLALKETLRIDKYHVAGHSLGGAVVWGLIAADAANILSATQVAPGSPYGFGGTKDVDGTPTYPDFAGSGGGLVNPEMVRRMTEGDRGADDPSSPRNVMNALYWRPPFRAAREEALLSSMLSEKMGDDRYPGDGVPSENWPGLAPGVHGPINAISPKYVGDTVERFVASAVKPPVLWVWGADDQIVSDTSLSEVGYLGKIGAVPGWPGDEVYPPQPMIAQIRAVLEEYANAGGRYRELRFEACGHTPYIEHPERFMEAFLRHIEGERPG